MKLSQNEKKLLKNYFNSIVICICSFIPDETAKEIIKNCNTYPEVISQVAASLRIKEVEGWLGEDLKEDQLNVLTIISEMYLKRNKSKYKNIEKPSEILSWFSLLIKKSLLKTENMIKKN